jgi:hypothetical protein
MRVGELPQLMRTTPAKISPNAMLTAGPAKVIASSPQPETGADRSKRQIPFPLLLEYSTLTLPIENTERNGGRPA